MDNGAGTTLAAAVGGKLPNQLGSAFEQRVHSVLGTVQNYTKNIVSEGRTRIPDIYDEAKQSIGEIKNRMYVTATQQIRDMINWAKETGSKFDLYVPAGARLSKNLVDQLGKIGAKATHIDSPQMIIPEKLLRKLLNPAEANAT